MTILFTHLIIVRLVRRWRGTEESLSDKILLYGSAAIGALSFAASHSQWFNAVEAEVYGISMMFTALVFWLAIRWADDPNSKNSIRYILLISYFVGLSTGVHLLNVLALSPIVLLIYFQKYDFTWKSFIIATGISMLAIVLVYPGVVSGIPKLISIGMWALAVTLLAGVAILIWSIRNKRTIISMVLFSMLLVVIGYSTYITIPIRSILDPEINENQPDSIESLISYLNREQYGSAGPVEVQNIPSNALSRVRSQGGKLFPLAGDKVLRFNILERNAPFWDYQINKMYIRYLTWQFGIGELNQLYIVPFMLGFLGAYWHFRRDPKRAFTVLMLFLMTGLAIIFYLNQPDPQPRERDYAYVGSYFAFALWIGMGVVALYEMIEETLKKKGEVSSKNAAIGLVAVLAAFAPLNMIVQNYHYFDRTGNFVAWDYSHNLLESCEPNSILFTNGDNDTFPLWYLQVVEKVRTDVRIVNLSLLNTDWYIKQLRDKLPPVPVSFSDDIIDNQLCGRTNEALLNRYWPGGVKRWALERTDGTKMEWNVPGTMYVPTGIQGEEPGKNNFVRVQDVMILHILEQNKWEKPVHFAVTVAGSNMIGLRNYVQMQGLVFTVYPEKTAGELNVPEMQERLFETFKDNYRGLDDPDVYLFPNVHKLLQNYRSGFLQLVYHYWTESRRTPQEVSEIPDNEWGDRFDELSYQEKALYALTKMEEFVPEATIPMTNRELLLQMGRLYAELGDEENARKRFESVLDFPGTKKQEKLQVAYMMMEYLKDPDGARQLIDKIIGENPSAEDLFNVAAIYSSAKINELTRETLNRIVEKGSLSRQQNFELATLYFGLRDYKDAEKIFLQLNEEDPSDGTVQGGLIQIYEATFDTAKAVELLEVWQQNNPGDMTAIRKLNKLRGSN